MQYECLYFFLYTVKILPGFNPVFANTCSMNVYIFLYIVKILPGFNPVFALIKPTQ